MGLPAMAQSTLRGAIAEVAASGRYVLRNVRIIGFPDGTPASETAGDGLILADLAIEHGRIAAVTPVESVPFPTSQGTSIDVGGRAALPVFVDCHTHLDKGHILPRTPSADGTFAGALSASMADRAANWSAEDVRRRMDFALRSAFHYGTAAIRTHLDSLPPQDAISWPVFEEMRRQWQGGIELQAACLFAIEFARDAAFLDRLTRRVAAAGGILGAVAYPVPDIDMLLDRMFATAGRYGLDLDFHADETADPSADALRRIAEAALRARFSGRVLVGHCCSLAMQDRSMVDSTLDKVAAAGLAVVALPACNLYLQDRRLDGTTPRWRGVTLLHEMRERGIEVALASDNTRDPFHPYGDLDMLDVFRLGTRVLHLEHLSASWVQSISATPAGIMGMDAVGTIGAGKAADFILFEGRTWSEVLSRPESNRIVVRSGVPLETSLPPFAELDGLTGLAPA